MSSLPGSPIAPTEGLPPPGSILDDKYVVESVLGVGGMGAVLLAMDQMLGQRVAIKVLLPLVAEQPTMVARFLREAQAAAAIQNDHVVRIYGLGKTDEGLPFIVMEHLTGQGLDQVARERSPLPISDVADMLLEVCRALAHAHAIGIVHRDLKPSNLFVCRSADGSERIKVLDFGISKAERLGGGVDLTATAQVLGTPVYMSPEQARCTKDVDARTDIWSLGVVCYELVCGVPPFAADTLSALVAKIVADQPIPHRDLRPDIPEQLNRLILWCMEKDPARRPPAIRQVVPYLRSFASARGIAAADSILRLYDSGLLATAVQLDIDSVSMPNHHVPLLRRATIVAGVAMLLVTLCAATYLLTKRAAPSYASAPASATALTIQSAPSSESTAPVLASGPAVSLPALPSAASSSAAERHVPAPPARSSPARLPATAASGTGLDPFDRF